MPEPGSLKEAACLIVQHYRQEAKFFSALLQAQDPSDPNRRDTLENLKRAMFPHLANLQKKMREREQQILDKAFRAGPMRIRC